ncbi:hypothetical protein D1BOALGB6SA_1545 [Olavius sp. associated proteobacterium Delta 1]|nr:hypothetical protein D1BOALGB6SA_1545 [Olavius sp. associated proteobacterium Delta 1]
MILRLDSGKNFQISSRIQAEMKSPAFTTASGAFRQIIP